MKLLKFNQFINELKFADKDEYDEYKKDHDIRKGTEVKIGDKPLVPPPDTDDSEGDRYPEDKKDSNAPMVPPPDTDDSEGDRGEDPPGYVSKRDEEGEDPPMAPPPDDDDDDDPTAPDDDEEGEDPPGYSEW